MNLIWLLILLSSTAVALLTSPDTAVTSLINGANAAVRLALSLVASYGFWLGFFRLLERSGVGTAISRLLRPVVRFLFPGENEQTRTVASLNISANLLGLGNASTPLGITAMKSMDDGSGVATDNQIMLLVLSATSLQLLPTTVIALRVSHGSLAPASFLLPCIAATVLSTLVGVTLCKACARAFGKRRKKAPEALPLKSVRADG